MPGSTPSRATPRKAAIDSMNSALRCRHSRTVPGMSASDSDAVITTAASAGCGRLRNRPGHEHDHQDDQDRADDPGELGLRAGPLGDGGARAAGADREALEQPGGQVRGADADHLLVAVGPPARCGRRTPRRWRSCRRARPARCRAPRRQRPEVGPGATCGMVSGGKPLRQHADEADAVVGEVEDATWPRSRARPRRARRAPWAASAAARGSARPRRSRPTAAAATASPSREALDERR